MKGWYAKIMIANMAKKIPSLLIRFKRSLKTKVPSRVPSIITPIFILEKTREGWFAKA